MRRRAKGEAPARLAVPEVVAAERPVLLGGDEEERDILGRKEAERDGLLPAAVQAEGEEDRPTTVDEGARDSDRDGDDAGRATGARRRKFRSLADIYKITRPVGHRGESKRSKQWQAGVR